MHSGLCSPCLSSSSCRFSVLRLHVTVPTELVAPYELYHQIQGMWAILIAKNKPPTRPGICWGFGSPQHARFGQLHA